MRREVKRIDYNKYLVWMMILIGIAIIVVGAIEIYKLSQTPEKFPSDSELQDPNWEFKQPRVWDFKNVFLALRAIDKKYAKYDADFHKESLRDKILVPPSVADKMINEINGLEASIGDNIVEDQNENKSIRFVLSARRDMLKSEKHFQEALQFGKSGVFTNQLNCEDRESIEAATKHYNLSNQYGWSAMRDLDRTMATLETAKELIGVNERRPLFYNNIFVDLGYLVNVNTEALEMYCDGTDIRANVTQLLKARAEKYNMRGNLTKLPGEDKK